MKFKLAIVSISISLSGIAKAATISGNWLCSDSEAPRFEMSLDEASRSVKVKSLIEGDNGEEKASTYQVLPLEGSPINIESTLAVKNRNKMGIQRIRLTEDSPVLLIAAVNGTLFIGEDGSNKFLIGDALGFYPHLVCDSK